MRWTAQPQRRCSLTPFSCSIAGTFYTHLMACGFKCLGRILDRYVRFCCESPGLVYACQVFDEITEQDVVAGTLFVSWDDAGLLKSQLFHVCGMMKLMLPLVVDEMTCQRYARHVFSPLIETEEG